MRGTSILIHCSLSWFHALGSSALVQIEMFVSFTQAMQKDRPMMGMQSGIWLVLSKKHLKVLNSHLAA